MNLSEKVLIRDKLWCKVTIHRRHIDQSNVWCLFMVATGCPHDIGQSKGLSVTEAIPTSAKCSTTFIKRYCNAVVSVGHFIMAVLRHERDNNICAT